VLEKASSSQTSPFPTAMRLIQPLKAAGKTKFKPRNKKQIKNKLFQKRGGGVVSKAREHSP
jgi:hypothetical protein